MFDRLDAPGGGWQGVGQQIFHAQEQHQQETYQFHGGLDPTGVEQLCESGECDGAINHFHDSGAQADEEGPAKTAPGALVDDRDVDGTDGYGDQKTAGEAGERGQQV